MYGVRNGRSKARIDIRSLRCRSDQSQVVGARSSYRLGRTSCACPITASSSSSAIPPRPRLRIPPPPLCTRSVRTTHGRRQPGRRVRYDEAAADCQRRFDGGGDCSSASGIRFGTAALRRSGYRRRRRSSPRSCPAARTAPEVLAAASERRRPGADSRGRLRASPRRAVLR